MRRYWDSKERFWQHTEPYGKVEKACDYALYLVLAVCIGWVINLLLGEWR